MKKNALTEIKVLDIKALREKAKGLYVQIAELTIDKNMNKLKDLKTLNKQRRDLAQVLTVLRQKELLEELEHRTQSSEGSNK